jgi:hypothetical protein
VAAPGLTAAAARAQLAYLLNATYEAGCVEWTLALAIALRDEPACVRVLDDVNGDRDFPDGAYGLWTRCRAAPAAAAFLAQHVASHFRSAVPAVPPPAVVASVAGVPAVREEGAAPPVAEPAGVCVIA